jgi:hypothetical protein
MTTPDAEIAVDPDALPLAEPPPLPALPAAGPKRSATLRQYAERIVDKLGSPAALLLAAEIDEAVADHMESGR